MLQEEHIGEVIETSSTHLVAQARRVLEENENDYRLIASGVCHDGDTMVPAFGQFLKSFDEDSPIVTYGLAYNITTTSDEPNRHATAYNKPRSQLRRENPEIFEILKTKFEVVIIGHKRENTIYQLLPPKPPNIHDFIYECNDHEIKALTDDLDFLRWLFKFNSTAPTDELVAACIRCAYRARGGDRNFLIRAGKEIARVLVDDYDRLKSIVKRISI
ncbi:MAG: hypothetical protein ACUVXI_13030 [bacterium]